MKTRALACSFCGSTADEVSRLIAGPRVFICDGCVTRCTEILAQHPPGAAVPPMAAAPLGRAHWWHRLFAWRPPLRASPVGPV